ncbi:MAG: hypothetical protein VXZ82_12715 [Planctomycetota bacterium]|nr:hypothetical protein [Planctomycetota bacterium]
MSSLHICEMPGDLRREGSWLWHFSRMSLATVLGRLILSSEKLSYRLTQVLLNWLFALSRTVQPGQTSCSQDAKSEFVTIYPAPDTR